MSKKITSIFVSLLALLVLHAVPVSAQRPVPATVKSSIFNKKQMDQKAMKGFKAPKALSGDLKSLPDASAFSARNKIKKADIKSVALNPLMGHVYYDPDDMGRSVYQFLPQASPNFEEVISHSYLSYTGSGAIIDNKYYDHYYYEFWGYLFFYRDVFDLETGELLVDDPIEMTDIAVCTAYDNIAGKNFGIYYDEDGNPNQLASYDYLTCEKNVIATVENSYLACASYKGYLYAITTDGDLYKIDEANGTETFVGATGLTPNYLQSACIDSNTGVFYWAYIDTVGSGIYQVNLETGEASEIYDFGRQVEIVYLQSMAPDAADDCPAGVEEYSLALGENPNTLVVSFTMPTTTVGGDALSGSLSYSIDIETAQYTGTANAGEAVVRELEGLETGMYNVTVRAISDAGNGASTKLKLWVGPDVVKAPETASLVIDDNLLATVTWSPVTEGIHDGYVSIPDVTYKVTRYPEGEVVANGISETTFSETVELDPLRLVYYEVSAIYEGNIGEPTATNKVRIGNPLNPSYSYAFDGTEDGLWTVVDNNNDGRTWVFGSGRAYNPYSTVNDADDWLLTPPLNLKAGKTYLLSFKAWANGESYPERVEASVGQGLEFDMYDNVIEPTDVTWVDQNVTLSGEVTVSADGVYYVGIHAISDADMFYLNVADFSLLDGDTPGAAENLVAVAGEKGALNATVTFNAPTKTCVDATLSDLTKIEVTRGGSVIATIDNPQVGAAYEVYDDNITASGFVTYNVVAYNSAGSGVTASTSVYVGVDVPAAAQNIQIIDNAPGITVTWDPVGEVGANGGYVDPTAVSYEVWSINGGYLDEVLETTTGTVYTDASVDLNDFEPSFYQLAIRAVNEIGSGSAMAGGAVAGTPLNLPFVDSFNTTGNALDQFWTISRPADSNSSWGISNDASSDDIGAGAYYLAQNAGDSGYLRTPRLNFEGQAAPVAVFKYMIEAGVDAQLYVGYDKQDGNGYVNIAQVADGKTITESAWQTAVVDLSALNGEASPLVSFYAVGNEANAIVYLDEIRIGDVYAEDIALTSVTAPRAVQVGEASNIVIALQNLGSNAVEEGSYTVKLYAGDKLFDETAETPALDAYAGKGAVIIPFVATPVDASPLVLRAEVEYAKDLDLTNNSYSASVNVRQNSVPTVNDLTATTSGYQSVKLTWGTPDTNQQTQGRLITEDFEDEEIFEDCSTGGVDEDILFGSFGQWTVYNGDNSQSYGWENVTIPNANTPKSWIPFRPENYFDLEEGMLVPYSGDQYMLSLDAAANPVPQTDDWLISPELSGNAQTISFFLTEITDQYGNEVYEVLYSTTDNDPSSFEVAYEGVATTEWEEINVDLPAGAKYFAIRNRSTDAFGLMVDDVTFEINAASAAARGADLDITGYNVYRDGELIATVGADVHEYIDTADTDGLHSYNVTVLYGTVESPLSNTVSVVTAINEVVAADALNNADITVYGANGAIIASGKGVYGTLRTGVYVIKNNETGAVVGVSKK